jgi:carbon-monoxide dehydrogenase medium subunit
MEICDFTYHRPRSLEEACRLGRELGLEARFHAGGTELLVDFRHRRDAATHLISLRDLRELAGITEGENGGLRIGGMATLADLTESPLVAERFPVLKEAALTMAGAQIRNQGTIGGNFCRAVSCADTPPVCIVGQASVRLVGPDGERTLPAEDFFTGPRQTVLAPGELLVEILIPPQPRRSGASYQRFSLRRGQALAVAAVAARLVLDGPGRIADARVGLTAVAPTPLLAVACMSRLRGEPPGEAVFAEAAAEAAAEAQPIDDLRGSEAFRRELVEVLTIRALEACVERADGGRA